VAVQVDHRQIRRRRIQPHSRRLRAFVLYHHPHNSFINSLIH
jgi:hypothetical protein